MNEGTPIVSSTQKFILGLGKEAFGLGTTAFNQIVSVKDKTLVIKDNTGSEIQTINLDFVRALAINIDYEFPKNKMLEVTLQSSTTLPEKETTPSRVRALSTSLGEFLSPNSPATSPLTQLSPPILKRNSSKTESKSEKKDAKIDKKSDFLNDYRIYLLDNDDNPIIIDTESLLTINNNNKLLIPLSDSDISTHSMSKEYSKICVMSKGKYAGTIYLFIYLFIYIIYLFIYLITNSFSNYIYLYIHLLCIYLSLYRYIFIC
jgi:hypothetical protein